MSDGKIVEQGTNAPDGVVGGKDLIETLSAIEQKNPASARAPGTAKAAIEAINSASSSVTPRRSLLDILLRRNK